MLLFDDVIPDTEKTRHYTLLLFCSYIILKKQFSNSLKFKHFSDSHMVALCLCPSRYRTERENWTHTIFTHADCWKDRPKRVNKYDKVLQGSKLLLSLWVMIYYSSIKGNESKVGHTDGPSLLPTEAKTCEFENPETDETLEEQQSSEVGTW